MRIAQKTRWQLPAAGISLNANEARELDYLIDAHRPPVDQNQTGALNGSAKDAKEQIEAVIASGQGFLVSPLVKKAIEEHAVQIAKSYYEEKGYAVKVRGKSYDLHCTHAKDVQIFVEVKGTQTSGDGLLLTREEVKFARQNKTDMALFVVYGIIVDKLADPPSASGGTTRLYEPWDIDSGELEPVAYFYRPPKL